ncbi:MAG: O-antigen ligase family protein [Ignavibacteriaceae bacterium]|nr:O-antigen ligase family protein [Ignavibacteriaceae bacterium]
MFYIITLPFLQHFSFNGVYVGDFDITPHMIIQLILIIIFLISYLTNSDVLQTKPFGIIDKLIILFILFALLSLLFGYSMPENHVKRWLLFYTGIFETSTFYFITLYLLNNNKDLVHEILVALMLSVFFSGIIAVTEFNIIGYNLIHIFLSRMRFGFGFHNTNLYGIYSALLFPLIVYLIYNHKSKAVRIISILSFSLLSLLSIMCFNRGTFIVMGLQIILLFFYTKNRKLIISLLVAFIGVAVYFSNLLLFYIFRFVGNNNPQGLDESALYRLEAWRIALKCLLLYPFGVGGGGFQILWEKYSFKPEIYLGTPHQLFLSIGIDYGILTLLVFIIILVVAFYYSYKIIESHSEASTLFKYVIISLIGLFVYGMLTDGELSHLSGFIAPNNGYSIILFAILSIISYFYSDIAYEKKK